MDLYSYKIGLGFTGILANTLKIKGSKLSFWKKNNLLPQRNSDLFNIGYMSLFTSDPANEIVDSNLFNLSSIMIAIRHKYINDKLEELTNDLNKVQQVIILGSGFDVRAATNYKSSNVKYFEVDNNEVQLMKSAIYKKNNINPNAVYIGINYITDNLLQKLVTAGVNFNLCTLFIYEGNCMYIKQESVNSLFMKINNQFSNYHIVMDYFSNEVISKITGIEEYNILAKYLASINAPLINGYDNIEKFSDINSLKILDNYSMGQLALLYQVHKDNIPEMHYYSISHMYSNR